MMAALAQTAPAIHDQQHFAQGSGILDPMNTRHLRAQLFHILHKPTPANPVARYANYFLAFLIVTNASFVALETIPSMSQRFGRQFQLFEAFSTAIFALEYVTRLWVCVEQKRFSRPLWGRLAYALQPLSILDLLVITTFWLPVDLRFLRVARLLRLLKVLHLDQLDESLAKIEAGLRKRSALMTVALTIMVLSIYAASALIYQLENPAQPTVFTSIPGTFWWAIETLTTIGYGDMVPITPLGKFFAGLISIFGIGIFALPTAIVTAVIVEAGVSESPRVICKHCGKPTHGAE